jgi:hypothetical protein
MPIEYPERRPAAPFLDWFAGMSSLPASILTAHHETSETVEEPGTGEGRNVYGRDQGGLAGKPLPGDRERYPSVEEAAKAAAERSRTAHPEDENLSEAGTRARAKGRQAFLGFGTTATDAGAQPAEHPLAAMVRAYLGQARARADQHAAAPDAAVISLINQRSDDPMNLGLRDQEHAAFSRYLLDQLGPILGPAVVGAAVPAYSAAKGGAQSLGLMKDATPASWHEVLAGLAPLLERLRERPQDR